MKSAYFICVFCLSLVLQGKADEPPSWVPYRVDSEDKKFFCWITFNDDKFTQEPWKRKWAIKVYSRDSVLLWRKDFQPSGYTSGLLSPDGKYFCFIEFWYYEDQPVVVVTSRDHDEIKIEGKRFKISPFFLKNTVSHKLWIGEVGYRLDFKSNPNLIINTIDNKTWLVDLKTGSLKSDDQKASSYFLPLVLGICLFIALTWFFLYKKRVNHRI